MTASNEWANRPADQRFTTLEDLRDKLAGRRLRSRAVQLDVHKMNATHDEHGAFRINGGMEAADPTHWSFGQLASWIGAPAGFLRDRLADSPELLTGTVNHCIKKSEADELKWLLIEREENGQELAPQLQAVTSPTYGRIWDADVTDAAMRLRERSNGRWHNPLAYARGLYGSKEHAVPSGLYASDRDVFIFMIDGGSFLEGGDGQTLNRGFIVTNSEVGSRTFTMTTFLHRGICGNHIIWGAQDVTKLAIRHTKNGPARFDAEAFPALMAYADRSHAEDEAVFKKANQIVLPEKLEDVSAYVLKAAKFTPREIRSAIDAAKMEEGDCGNLWQLVQGFTAFARTYEFMDARTDLETRAGKLLDLANATALSA